MINRKPRHAQLVYLHVADGPGLTPAEQPIVMVWRSRKLDDGSDMELQPTGGATQVRRDADGKTYDPNQPYQYIVSRLSAQTGAMRDVGQIERATRSPHAVVEGPDVVFLAAADALFVVSESKTERFDAARGLPGDKVSCLAWLGQRLYIAMEGGIAEFDPVSQQFNLVATSKAVTRRHKLDGGQPYDVTSMLADRKHNCIWLSVDGRSTPERTGIWRYTLQSGELQQVNSDRTSLLTWSDGAIFYMIRNHGIVTGNTIRGRWPFYLLDPSNATASSLEGIMPFGPSIPGMQPPGWVFLKGYILTAPGNLTSPTSRGNPYQSLYPWQIVQRLGDGALVAARRVSSSNQDIDVRLWRVEPLKGE